MSDPSRRNGVLSISPQVIRGDSATPERTNALRDLVPKQLQADCGNRYFGIHVLSAVYQIPQSLTMGGGLDFWQQAKRTDEA